MHIVRIGRFTLPVPPDTALPYFTAEGESAWVAGWEPVIHNAPEGDATRAGTVFETAVGGETTLWLVLAFDRAARRARYARITPGSRLGTVDIACRPSEGATEVEVTYELTSLTPDGEAKLAAMTEPAFAATLAGWERDLRAIL